jgi:hypothetical protein
MYITHLEAFLFKLDNNLLLKCKDIFFIFESQITAHDVKPGFVTFVVHADFRVVNVDILNVLFMSVYVLFTLQTRRQD